MKINKYLIATSLAGAFVLFLNTNSSTVQAATIQIPTQGTSYVRKGNTYKLHLKEAGRVTVRSESTIVLIGRPFLIQPIRKILKSIILDPEITK